MALSNGLKRNQSLIALNLSGNNMTHASMKQLVKSFPVTLVDLDISDNELKDEGVAHLSHYLYYRKEEPSDDDEDQEP